MVVLYILVAISILTSVVGIVVSLKTRSETKMSESDKKDIVDSFGNNVNVIAHTLLTGQQTANVGMNETIKNFKEDLIRSHEALEKRVTNLVERIDARMLQISKMQEDKLEAIRQSNDQSIKSLQEDNNKQLDKMRETVDEKLSKTINERFEQSFDLLRKQLENVHKSLGEMQTIASDVGSLTKVLSNVKTTGVFGEIQLGALFDQLLTQDQYETNFVTADAHDPVEFAIKLPGQSDGEFVYLPVDSKFPFTVYTDLQNAYDANDFELVKQKKTALKTKIKDMAKDISTKYIYPPKTTNFAVMFLPVEGLYAEVAKMGLIDELQSKYNVTIAGPTTFSALLNSLQMGFRTLAIQKKSGEVWKVLGAVRTEFEKFNGVVDKIQQKFDDTSREFDKLVGTRSRMIASKLKSIEQLDSKESSKVLGLQEEVESEEE
ncbi:MAG: DNA recombination protein RmuC [Clostridia bacterium]|nr:DNA recombination protein RmuC [Clostridia bacterium]